MKPPDGRSLVAVAICLLVAAAAPQGATLENKLKVAFVSKFPQFVEWPAAVFDGHPTLDVCVAAPDEFGPDFQDLAAGGTLNGRAVVARRVYRESDVDGCQVLFLPSGRRELRGPLLRRAQSLPILTVSDDPRFLGEGGIIVLRLVNHRMRFEVNLAAAQRVGLRISSQLLRLALAVQGGRP